MKLPRFDDDPAVKQFADELESGNVPRVRRLTYAEVTPEGPTLKPEQMPQ